MLQTNPQTLKPLNRKTLEPTWKPRAARGATMGPPLSRLEEGGSGRGDRFWALVVHSRRCCPPGA